MGNDTKIYGSKEKITGETHLISGQILWGKTDSNEGHNHYKIIFNIIGEDNNRTISVIGVSTKAKDDFLKINPKYFCGPTKIDGWLDVKYLNEFSYQDFLAMPELYLEQKVIADKDLITNIKNILNKLYELKYELLKTQEKLRQTKQVLEAERDESETNMWIGAGLASLATVGAFFLGKHLEEQHQIEQNKKKDKNKDNWY